MRGAPRALGLEDDPAAPGSTARFRVYQLGLSGLHLGQAILVLAIGLDVVIEVTSSDGSPLFGVSVSVAIATYFLLATLSHGLGATVLRGLYEADLARGMNRMRWVEYSLSATIMMVLIALYAGVTDIVALSVIAVANVAMILCGWRQEVRNPPARRRTVMRPFWTGVSIGLVPWVIIALEPRGQPAEPGVRGRDLRVALPALRLLRPQPVAPVPGGRALGRLPLRRAHRTWA